MPRKRKQGKKNVDQVQNKRIRKIEKRLKPEKKFVEARVTSTNFVAAGAIVQAAPLNALAAGAGQGARIGNQVTDEFIRIRLFALNANVAAAVCRFVLFKWMDETAPSVAQVLTGPGGTTDFLSPININSLRSGQLKVLKDVSFDLGRDIQPGPPLVSASDNIDRQLQWAIKLNGKQTYDNSTAADFISGQVWLLAIGSATATYQLTSQYQYTDC